MMRFLLVVGLSLAMWLWAHPTFSEQACVTLEQHRARVEVFAGHFEVRQVGDFVGQRAQELVQLWNELPPVSNAFGDRVVVFEARLEERVWPQLSVAIFNNGCLVDFGVVDRRFLYLKPKGKAT